MAKDECPQPDAPIDVLYVAGCGRSGTTLLDMILGSHPLVYGAGELFWYGSDLAKENFSCPCGKKVSSCDFWTRVDRFWRGIIGAQAAANFWKLKQCYEGPRFRGIGRVVFQKFQASRSFEEYCRQNYWLLYAIQQISGKPFIVDSSALPTRCLAYRFNPYVTTRTIHLVRDPRGVVRSMQKHLVRKACDGEGIGLSQRPRSGLRTAVTWLGYNALTGCVVAGVGGKAVTRVRYEDLVLQPGETIRGLGQQLGIELGRTAAEIEVKRAVSSGCTFGGNRARMSDSLQFVLDDKWRNELGLVTKLATGMVTSPLLLRYGYKVLPSRVCEADVRISPKKLPCTESKKCAV